MNKSVKQILALVMALAVVSGLMYLSWDYKLKASEDDGNTTAAEMQEAVIEEAQPVEVVVPAVVEEETETEPEPEIESAAEESVVAEEPAATEEPVAEEESAATEEPVVVEEPAATEELVVVEEPAATEEPVAEEEPAATEELVVEEEPAATEEPVVTDEPAVTEEPVVTEEPAATEETVVEEEPAATEEPQITVDLRLENEGDLYYGDRVNMMAEVAGAEGVAYSIVWQYDDGEGWKDLGESGLSYAFVLDEVNAAYDYRVVVVTD